MRPYLWTQYSKKLVERILNPRNIARSLEAFQERARASQDMRVVVGQQAREGSRVLFSIIVDTTDGTIADVAFSAFGKTALIGAADATCEILLRKSYIQAKRVTRDLIDQKLRDVSHVPAFPEEVHFEITLILLAIEEAMDQCMDLPVSTPIEVPVVEGEEEAGHPDWHLFSPKEKLEQIQLVIETEIQPSIALDAGGIRVVAFYEEKEVVIAYEGACTTCPSATGATLDAIQHMLRARLSPILCVKADPSFLHFGLD